MGKIKLLEKNVSELIAAGEVVERPASVVKELLENAIDSGASAITVEIRGGGIRYIRVTDNGSGMDSEDIPIAFLRHATSKIRVSDDLSHIATLGFRGEALSSIAAVSRISLLSKTRENRFGMQFCMEGGGQISAEEMGCPDGTTIIVRDLFYNVPARLKFLKKDSTEGSMIAGIMDKLALSHPEISMKLISEQKTKLHTPGNGDLLSAIHAVLGKEFADALLPVEHKAQSFRISGFVSSPKASRGNRSMQHFFVNSRYIHSKIIASALEEGYKNAIMTGKYPFCVLMIELPLDRVDVNVHPAKTEVRFVEEKAVFDTVYFAVKEAIAKDDILKKAAEPFPKTQTENLLSTFSSQEHKQEVLSVPKQALAGGTPTQSLKVSESVVYPERKDTKKPLEEEYRFIRSDKLILPSKEDMDIRFIPEEPEEDTAEENSPSNTDTQAERADNLFFKPKIIGEVFKTYLLFELGEEVFFLDKHAAHERILFEKLKKSVDCREKQILLNPVIVNLTPEEEQTLWEYQKTIEDTGFTFEEFGNHSIAIREVPLVLLSYDTADILLDTLHKLSDHKRDILSNTFEELLHSMACRCAIKANDNTTIEELTALLSVVLENDEIRHCPHGRPVVISFSKAELEKRFGRA